MRLAFSAKLKSIGYDWRTLAVRLVDFYIGA